MVSGKEVFRAGVVSVSGLCGKVITGELGVFSGNLIFSGDSTGKVLISGNEPLRTSILSVRGADLVLSGEPFVSSGVSSGIVAFPGKLPLLVRDILLSGARREGIPGERVSPGGVFSGKLSRAGEGGPRAASTGTGVLGGVPTGGGVSLPLSFPSPLTPGRTSPPPPTSSPTRTPSSAGRGVPACSWGQGVSVPGSAGCVGVEVFLKIGGE